MKRQVPLYDRRRLEALVMEHKLRVHMQKKATGKSHKKSAGVKAP